MSSLFREVRPSHGPFNRINILSPQTPAKAGESLQPCRLARTPIEVRGWSRPGLGHYISRRTMAYGELWRADEDGADELVVEYAIVEDEEGRPDSVSAQRGTACVKWTFTDLEIVEPGAYYYVVKIMNDRHQLIGQIESAEVVIEPSETAQSAVPAEKSAVATTKSAE